MPGKSHGQRSLAGYSPWGRKELDDRVTEQTYTHNLHNPRLKSYYIQSLGDTAGVWKLRMLEFPGGLVAKSLPANEGDMGSIPGLRRPHMLQDTTATEPLL